MTVWSWVWLKLGNLITTYDFISKTLQAIVVAVYKTIKVVHGYASPKKDIEGRTNIGGQDLWSNLLCGTMLFRVSSFYASYTHEYVLV